MILQVIHPKNPDPSKNRDFSRDPQARGTPGPHKPPISFTYFKGFLWEWYGSSMGMGVPLLQVPGIFVDQKWL